MASLWLDMEDSPEAAYDQNQYERVTEVTAFVYSGRDDMFTRALPVLPVRRSPRTLKEIFLSHYRPRADGSRPRSTSARASGSTAQVPALADEA